MLLNALMGLPPVVIGLLVYLALSRSGPLGSWGLLFTPQAMVIAQTILVAPIIAALARQTIEGLSSGATREEVREAGVEGAAGDGEELEALLFAAAAPLSAADLARRLPEGADVGKALAALKARYADRGVTLEVVAGTK